MNYYVSIGLASFLSGVLYKAMSDYLSKKVISKKEIKIFDMNLFDPSKYQNIFIIGRPGSGKTTLILEIINWFSSNVDIIISPTESLERFYIKNVPKAKIIYKHYSPDFISRFVKKQVVDINDHIIDEKPSVIVLDNCLMDSGKDNVLTDLLVNKNFYKITNLISSSHPFDFGKYFVSSMDFIVIFKEEHYIFKEQLYNEYVKPLMTKKEFYELFNLSDHQALVINCKTSEIFIKSN